MYDPYRKGTEVARQALYDQVWSTPMTKLAKSYGISDVALAKTCKRLDIPYPERGYWRKKETGKPVKQLALPQNQDPAKQRAIIHRTVKPELSLSDELAKRIVVEQAEEQKITVPERLGKTHRLLNGHLTEWRTASADEYGAIASHHLRELNIRVSRQSLSRAIRILNSLFLALEHRGYQVAIHDGYKKALAVRINGEPVQFGIEEKFQRIELPQDPKRQSDSWNYPRHEYRYEATGVLTLKINEWVDGVQKSWSDGKTARLESGLNVFLIGLLKVADLLKAQRLKREEEERLRVEAQRQHEEEERRKQEERDKRDALLKEADSWARSQRLRDYISAVKSALVAKYGTPQLGSEADQWLTWADKEADQLDPLRGL
jgi:hypothetical protein